MKLGEVEIVDERAYAFGSPDNIRPYPFERNWSENYRPSSVHGVWIRGIPLAVFGSNRGATGIHDHSATLIGNHLYLAVSNRIVCISIDPFEFKFSVEVDGATCFGIHFHQATQTLFSHGELQIVRLSLDGWIEWTAGGEDIFTEGFELLPDCIRVTDFNGKIYRLDYASGKCL